MVQDGGTWVRRGFDESGRKHSDIEALLLFLKLA